jgi:hypothetical protein
MPDVIGDRLWAAPNSDLTALQRELAGAGGNSDRHFDDDNDELVDDDEDDADDDQDTWSPTRR